MTQDAKRRLFAGVPKLLLGGAFICCLLWICFHRPWPAESRMTIVDDQYLPMQTDVANVKDLALPVDFEREP